MQTAVCALLDFIVSFATLWYRVAHESVASRTDVGPCPSF